MYIDSSGTDRLYELLVKELTAVPIRFWGYFYPAHVAVWKFLQDERPGLLGELESGYDDEPYFDGTGSEWFTNVLANDDEYTAALESIMYPLVRELSPLSKSRGFVYREELLMIDRHKVAELARAVMAVSAKKSND